MRPDLEALRNKIVMMGSLIHGDDCESKDKHTHRCNEADEILGLFDDLVASLPARGAEGPAPGVDQGDERKAWDLWRRSQLYEGSPILASWGAWQARGALRSPAPAPLAEPSKAKLEAVAKEIRTLAYQNNASGAPWDQLTQETHEYWIAEAARILYLPEPAAPEVTP